MTTTASSCATIEGHMPTLAHPAIPRIAAAILIAAMPAVLAPAQDAQPAPRIGVMHRHGLAGVVTSVNGSTLVIEVPENVSFTVHSSPSTAIVGRGGAATIGDIHRGDPILASGGIDEQARTIKAQQITLQQPFAATMLERQRANFGKTWTAGIVTAADATSITVQRRDGVFQSFSIAPNTVWRLRDQDATSSLLHPGEVIRVELRPAGPAEKVTIQGMARQDPTAP